jgi:hypothetical protein
LWIIYGVRACDYTIGSSCFNKTTGVSSLVTGRNYIIRNEFMHNVTGNYVTTARDLLVKSSQYTYLSYTITPKNYASLAAGGSPTISAEENNIIHFDIRKGDYILYWGRYNVSPPKSKVVLDQLSCCRNRFKVIVSQCDHPSYPDMFKLTLACQGKSVYFASNNDKLYMGSTTLSSQVYCFSIYRE